ncbi:MAG: hypothetical protein P1U56_02560 [Saprospiraceae bacterium]|nr:hypothetical protein [Saprospiraceae bacterium]
MLKVIVFLLISTTVLSQKTKVDEWHFIHDLNDLLDQNKYSEGLVKYNSSIYKDTIFTQSFGNYLVLKILYAEGEYKVFESKFNGLKPRTKDRMCADSYFDDKFIKFESITSYCTGIRNDSKKKLDIDSVLLKELVLMHIEDQQFRTVELELRLDEEFVEKLNKSGLNHLMEEARNLPWLELCKDHKTRINEMIEKNGVPKYEKIGPLGVSALFVLFLHHEPSFMDTYFDELRQLFNPHQLSYMYDKVCVKKGVPQKYGTQVIFSKEEKRNIFYPIEDVSNVDSLRFQIGLSPIANYAKKVGIRM